MAVLQGPIKRLFIALADKLNLRSQQLAFWADDTSSDGIDRSTMFIQPTNESEDPYEMIFGTPYPTVRRYDDRTLFGSAVTPFPDLYTLYDFNFQKTQNLITQNLEANGFTLESIFVNCRANNNPAVLSNKAGDCFLLQFGERTDSSVFQISKATATIADEALTFTKIIDVDQSGVLTVLGNVVSPNITDDGTHETRIAANENDITTIQAEQLYPNLQKDGDGGAFTNKKISIREGRQTTGEMLLRSLSNTQMIPMLDLKPETFYAGLYIRAKSSVNDFFENGIVYINGSSNTDGSLNSFYLLRIDNNSVEKFTVDYDGNVTANGEVTATNITDDGTHESRITTNESNISTLQGQSLYPNLQRYDDKLLYRNGAVPFTDLNVIFIAYTQINDNMLYGYLSDVNFDSEVFYYNCRPTSIGTLSNSAGDSYYLTRGKRIDDDVITLFYYQSTAANENISSLLQKVYAVDKTGVITATNITDDGTHETRISTNETNITTNSSRLTTLETQVLDTQSLIGGIVGNRNIYETYSYYSTSGSKMLGGTKWRKDAINDGLGTPNTADFDNGKFYDDQNWPWTIVPDNGVINPYMFGARGDGAADDRLPLQYTMNVADKYGYDVYIPDGTYVLSDYVTIHSNTYIKMSDRAVITRTSAAVSLFFTNHDVGNGGYGNNENIIIEGGVFDGKESTLTGNLTMMGFAHSSKIILRDIKFKNNYGWHCIEFNACKDCRVYNCHAYNQNEGSKGSSSEAFQYDIALNFSAFPWNDGNGIGRGTPYDKTTCQNIVYEGCTLEDVPAGIGGHSYEPAIFVNNITIVNCFFKNCTYYGVSGKNMEDLKINNNSFENMLYGVRLTQQSHAVGDGPRGIQINGNSFVNMKNSGLTDGRAVYISGDSTVFMTDVTVNDNVVRGSAKFGLTIDYADRVTMTGNTCTGCDRTGLILYACKYGSITGNVAVDNNVSETAGEYDIKVYKGARNNEYITLTGNVGKTMRVQNTSEGLIDSNVLETSISVDETDGNIDIGDNLPVTP